MGVFKAISTALDSVSKLLLDIDDDVNIKPVFHFEGRNGAVGLFEASARIRKRRGESTGKIEKVEETFVASDHRRELLISEISEKFGIPHYKLQKLCRDGVIKAKKRRGLWFIDLESMEQYIKRAEEK